jgi:hypothetical protein
MEKIIFFIVIIERIYPSRNDTGTSAMMSSNGFPIPKIIPSLKKNYLMIFNCEL